ncbi:MAG: NUDIX domain-containing protein [Pseudomonadales bacterium]|nr:NUDIX domain-containing protein [Pseudomonadales bacterium]
MPYFKVLSAVYVILERDGEVMLARRHNTGYCDGLYSLPAGHVDDGENTTEAMIREAKEEVGIEIKKEDLEFVHVGYRKVEPDHRIDFFFTCKKWLGEPKIIEPEKCDELRWVRVDQLPESTIPFIKKVFANIQSGTDFAEYTE